MTTTILMHNGPDADAVVSAYLMKKQHPKAEIVYGGSPVTKADIRKLVEFLDLSFKRIEDGYTTDHLITVDCQPRGGNVTKVNYTTVEVYDHHRDESPNIPPELKHINKDCPACSLLIYNTFNPTLTRIENTALLFAIYQDTNDFNSLNDNSIIKEIQSAGIDEYMFNILKSSKITLDDLYILGRSYGRYLPNSKLLNSVIVKLDTIDSNLLGLVSDNLSVVSDADKVITYYETEEGAKFSVRSKDRFFTALEIAKAISSKSGGRKHQAGGFVPINDYMEYTSVQAYIEDKLDSLYSGYILVDSRRDTLDNLEGNIGDLVERSKKVVEKKYINCSEFRGKTIAVWTSSGLQHFIADDQVLLFGLREEISLYASKQEFLEDYDLIDKGEPYKLNINAGDIHKTIIDTVRYYCKTKPVSRDMRKIMKPIKVITKHDSVNPLIGKEGDFLAEKEKGDIYIINKEDVDNLYV